MPNEILQHDDEANEVKGRREDGGPAFPHPTEWSTDGGMSLRDHFAGEAIAIFGDATIFSALREEALARGVSESVAIAGAVYEIADAMLKERAK
jgi:hypothetical protein